MPIFIEWKWVKKTETFLAVFHFWDDGTKQNLRMRKVTEGYETCFSIDEEIPKDGLSSAIPIPCYIKGATKHDAYMSWAPSHPEFCLLTELLTYANLINGLKPTVRRELRAKLEGHAITQEVEGKKYINFFILDSELMKKMNDGKMVSFADQWGISFEVCLPYVEYVRKLLEPFI